jgi:branched-chain amino acid transport system ATP-binding protein
MADVQLRNANVFYGKACALEHITIGAEAERVTGLLGRNGAGKTTLLNAVMGLLPIASGEYEFKGRDARGLQPFQLARLGLALVPADRQVYGELTVEENLMLARHSGRTGLWTSKRVFDMFPGLNERRRGLAQNLSGGEKQMLAIGRALLTNPSVLLMDEPTEGLAPLLVAEVVDAIRAIKSQGVSVLVVEQNLKAIVGVLDDAHVLESGRLMWSGPASELMSDRQALDSLLGV